MRLKKPHSHDGQRCYICELRKQAINRKAARQRQKVARKAQRK